MTGAISMDNVLNADFGETDGKLVVRYKKTINTKQYESEVIEMETQLNVDNSITGAGRMAMATLLAAQLEYTCYVGLLRKNQVRVEDFVERRDQLANACNEVCSKYESVTGKDISTIVKI